DMAAIHKKYGEKIKEGRKSFEKMFKRGDHGLHQLPMRELFLHAVDAEFQALHDSQAFVAGADFRPKGLALHFLARFGADTETTKYLKHFKRSRIPDLAKWPAGAVGYWGVEITPKLFTALEWMQGILPASGEPGKALRLAAEELAAAGP